MRSDGNEVDANPAWSHRQKVAKEPAARVWAELTFRRAGGTRLAALLNELSPPALVRRVVETELRHPENPRRANANHHHRDLLIDVVAEIGLDSGWSPGDEFEVDRVTSAVIELALARAATAHESLASVGPGVLVEGALRRIADGVSLFGRLLLTHRYQPIAGVEDAEVRLRRAGQEALCRCSVVKAASDLNATLVADRPSVSNDAGGNLWTESAVAVLNPYIEIIDLHDDEQVEPVATKISGSEVARLKVRAYQVAEDLGVSDDGMLRACLRVAIRRHTTRLADVGKSVGPAMDSVHDLEDRNQVIGSSSLEPPDDMAGRMAEGLDELLAHGSRLAADARSMLEVWQLCHQVSGDGGAWMARHYPPISDRADGGLSQIWSLVQATDPHRVVWPGYERPSGRQRAWVVRAREKFDALRLPDDGQESAEQDMQYRGDPR